jgi:hypothetical protein
MREFPVRHGTGNHGNCGARRSFPFPYGFGLPADEATPAGRDKRRGTASLPIRNIPAATPEFPENSEKNRVFLKYWNLSLSLSSVDGSKYITMKL